MRDFCLGFHFQTWLGPNPVGECVCLLVRRFGLLAGPGREVLVFFLLFSTNNLKEIYLSLSSLTVTFLLSFLMEDASSQDNVNNNFNDISEMS